MNKSINSSRYLKECKRTYVSTFRLRYGIFDIFFIRFLTHFIYFFVVILLLPSVALGVHPTPPEKPPSFVIDLAEIFRPDTKELLNALLAELSTKTGGDAVIILTVGSLDGENIRDFSFGMHEKWSPGSRGSNGILIVFAREGGWWITTGYEMDGIIPDSMIGTLGRKYIDPNIANGRIDEGVSNTVKEIVSAIARERSVEITGIPCQEDIIINVRLDVIIGVFIIMIVVATLFLIKKLQQRKLYVTSMQKLPNGSRKIRRQTGLLVIVSVIITGLLFCLIHILYSEYRVTQEKFITSIHFEFVERLEQWLTSKSWLVTVSPNKQIGQFTPMIAAAGSNRVDVMEMLVRHGANIDGESTDHFIPLEAALTERNTEAAQWIAIRSQKINHRDPYGQSPLALAAWINDAAMIKLLLDRGANPMATDVNGDTVLHTAAQYLTDKQVLELLFRDCNVCLPNKAGEFPLSIAIKFKNTPAIEVLSKCEN